jgi:hypothetical protein
MKDTNTQHFDQKYDQSDCWRLFADSVDTLLTNEQAILSRPNWYFSRLAFMNTIIGVVSLGVCLLDDQLSIGDLLTLWREGFLKGQCRHCDGEVLFVSFSGNMQRVQWWDGLCLGCRQWIRGHYVADEKFEQTYRRLKELRKKDVPEDLDILPFNMLIGQLIEE